MSYTKKVWKDYPDTTTPVNAENLNHIEKGVADAHVAISDINTDLGNTDISTIGNGTVTGAISQINSELSDISPATGSCTFNNGIGATNFFSRLVKVKNIVFVMCQFRLSVSVTTNTNIYNLPAGFIPQNADQIVLFSKDNTTQMNVTTNGHLALGATQQPNEYTCIGFYRLD